MTGIWTQHTFLVSKHTAHCYHSSYWNYNVLICYVPCCRLLITITICYVWHLLFSSPLPPHSPVQLLRDTKFCFFILYVCLYLIKLIMAINYVLPIIHWPGCFRVTHNDLHGYYSDPMAQGYTILHPILATLYIYHLLPDTCITTNRL